MTITLYDAKMAPSPRRARIFMREKQVPFEIKMIDLMKGEHFSEDYRALNPECTVPTVALEDGTALTDNASIAAYFEAAYPDPPLFGRTPQEKAEIAGWNAKIERDGLVEIRDGLRNSNPAFADRALTGPHNWSQIPELAERATARLDLFFEMLNEHLKGKDFIAGNQFSIADITGVVTVDFARVLGRKAAEQYDEIARWRSAIKARPSFSE
ncbi:MAG: glutathione S-transferase family protein [Pseudomonadota bacterium]